MWTAKRRAAVLLALAALLMTSCTRYVDDARAVAGPRCEAVDAPLTAIPVQGDDEPVMKIPQPDGWERSTLMDSELIRFAMVNQSLVKNAFAPNVVVTLESAPGSEDASVVFENQRDALESMFGSTDLQISEHTLCGQSAATVRYEIPAIGNIAAHPAIAVTAVLHTDTTTYAVSVTAQTTDPDAPAYQRDVETILTGFQLLPPSSN